MSEYVPTPRLRWVDKHNDPRSYDIVNRVLQQWWANPEYDPRPLSRQESPRLMSPGEWRDVPIEADSR